MAEKQETILIVDDEEAVTRLLIRNYQVRATIVRKPVLLSRLWIS